MWQYNLYLKRIPWWHFFTQFAIWHASDNTTFQSMGGGRMHWPSPTSKSFWGHPPVPPKSPPMSLTIFCAAEYLPIVESLYFFYIILILMIIDDLRVGLKMFLSRQEIVLAIALVSLTLVWRYWPCWVSKRARTEVWLLFAVPMCMLYPSISHLHIHASTP